MNHESSSIVPSTAPVGISVGTADYGRRRKQNKRWHSNILKTKEHSVCFVLRIRLRELDLIFTMMMNRHYYGSCLFLSLFVCFSPVLVSSWTTTTTRSGATTRRNVLEYWTAAAVAAVATTTITPPIAWAADDAAANADVVTLFRRETDTVSYSITIPSGMKQSQKPVKTHLDEINFVSETVKGYQYGITVDPVRINSLKEVRTHAC
jgi:uncharacterized protein YggU (UPF0235/DUF167 family)